MKKIFIISIICLLVLNGLGAGATFIKNSKSNQNIIMEEYDMVIITTDMFSESIQPLIDHKNSVGVKTFLKTTQDIYTEYDGRDEIEQIKFFIKDSLETYNISYVLIIGDIEKVPIRTSWVSFSYGDDLVFESCITDHYYADIYDENGSFCSWDSNENDRFGETIQDIGFYNNTFEYIDEVDLYPDICIGRLPCSNIDEVNIVINKIISYETQDNFDEWFNRMILMGGDSFPYSHGWGFPGCEMYEGEHVTGYIGDNIDGFDLVHLWTSLRKFTPFHINREINKGAGFISYSGHGSPEGIGTHLPNSSLFRNYHAPRLFRLNNDDRLPIVFLSACSTAKLDSKINDMSISYFAARLFYFLAGVTPYSEDTVYPCFAWQLVKKSSGGAVAVIGATSNGLAGEAGDFITTGIDRFNVQFFLSYEKGMNVGDLFIHSKQDYMINAFPTLSECINIEVLSLIGDPSLRIGGYN